MKRFLASLFVSLLTLFSAMTYATEAADFWQYPLIKNYGSVHFWPNTGKKLDTAKTYKVIFDLKGTGKGLDKVSKGLDHVARAINIFKAENVPLKQVKMIIIIHGPATAVAMNKEAFAKQFSYQNPNLELIDELSKAGVDIQVCGTALAEHQLTPAEVNPKIKIATSALTTLIRYQNDGYALIPM